MFSGFDISGFTTSDNRLDAAPAYIPISSHTMTRMGRIVRYGRWWAVKSLSPDCPDPNLGRLILEKEFQILISLSHPHVVRATEMAEIPSLGLSIVMEFVDGCDLESWLRKKPSLKLRKEMARQIISTFAYLHDAGVNHRDIKPENLMVDSSGNLKVIDFGLGDRDDFVYIKHVTGTPSFAAPELAADADADPSRADVYSIGRILAMLDLGRSWRSTVRKATQADPARRPGDASALASFQRRHIIRRSAVIIAAATIAIAALAALSLIPSRDAAPVEASVTAAEAPPTTTEAPETIVPPIDNKKDTHSSPTLVEKTTPKPQPTADKSEKEEKTESPTQTLIIALLQASSAWNDEKRDAAEENREFDFDNVRKKVGELRRKGIGSGWSRQETEEFDRQVSSGNFRSKGQIGSLSSYVTP